tara:strand:+ start:1179 stop:1700 length:522 start_codon:yes stop_codon:yes gene_type:complete
MGKKSKKTGGKPRRNRTAEKKKKKLKSEAKRIKDEKFKLEEEKHKVEVVEVVEVVECRFKTEIIETTSNKKQHNLKLLTIPTSYVNIKGEKVVINNTYKECWACDSIHTDIPCFQYMNERDLKRKQNNDSDYDSDDDSNEDFLNLYKFKNKNKKDGFKSANKTKKTNMWSRRR